MALGDVLADYVDGGGGVILTLALTGDWARLEANLGGYQGVPEPSTLFLGFAGAAALALGRRGERGVR